MISFEEFQDRCLIALIEERKADDPSELKAYIHEDESQEILHDFYDQGVDRYHKNFNHDEDVAFGYCISTAEVNLSLLYSGKMNGFDEDPV